MFQTDPQISPAPAKRAHGDELSSLRERVAELEQALESSHSTERVQTALYRIADIANSPDDTSNFYAELHNIIDALVDVENLYIAIYHPNEDAISFPYYVDNYDNEQGPHSPIHNPTKHYPLSSFPHSPTGHVFRSGQLQHFDRDGLAEMAKAERMELRGKICEDWIGVPLIRGSQVLGVLAIQSYKPDFRYGTETEALLTYMSQHIASALQWRRDSDSIRQAHLQLKEANEGLQRQAEEIQAANTRLQRILEERQRTQEKLVHDAFHDDLTGLPNRALLTKRLEELLELSHDSAFGPVEYALLFLDLDGFKVVNDSLGHLVGDDLLVQVAERLVESCRNNDTVVRLGGDEFCILLDKSSSRQDAASSAQRIFAALSVPFPYGEQQIFISTSIGIATSNEKYETPEELIRDADAAMYEAKANGRAQYRVFNQSMRRSAIDRLQLETRLRHAVAKQKVQVVFQPIYDLSTGKLASFEALARWRDKQLGTINPSQFIQVAEEIGAIHELGMQIMGQAARQISLWRRKFAHARDLNVNINVSCRQVDDPFFVDTALNMVDAVKLPRENVCLEITETSLLENIANSRSALEQLREARVKLALDDFGTGYSSLAYVHQLPMTELKIDNSFISSIETDQRSAALVELIQSLSQKMNLDLVAEGIETEEQLRIVRDMGVRFGQGYHLGRPMSAEQAEALIVDQGRRTMPSDKDS